MEVYPVKYAVLRYQRDWDNVTLTGLQRQEDGALTLARVPAPADGLAISLPPPFNVDPSGIALGPCMDLYLSDTANNIVVFTDEVCGARVVLPSCNGSGNALGQFNAPRGLLVGPPGGLYVADSGNARIQVFRLPTLELHAVWDESLRVPTCLAADSQNRVNVLDPGLHRVLGFNAGGVLDDAYNTATMAQPPTLKSPFSLAVGAQDILYVADADDQSNTVLSFDVSGKALGTLPKNASAAPAKPRALAAHHHWLYVADSDSGQIWVYDCVSGVYVGTAANFHGPVAAMTVDHAGATLYVKPGSGQNIIKLQTLAVYIHSGTLVTGPLNAGENSEWERAHVKAEIPACTSVGLFTFVSDNSGAMPTFKDPASALDILVPPLPGLEKCQPGQKRYLWMQVQLNSSNQQATPVLQQVQAQTTGESYLDHLPAVYRKEDLPRRFLERWLALFRSELGDLEQLLEDMPRLFDPVTTPEEYLHWLASWLAFEFPDGKSTREKRLLLERAHELYTKRGTPSGIREFIELYADARAHLFEAFRERHVWQLGITSALGFDTALASNAPNGMIVAGVVPADPKYFGLQGEYYCGPNFEIQAITRTDPTIDFVWGTGLAAPSMRRCRSAIRSVAWSLDGMQLVTGSADQTAKLWDVGTRKELLTFSGHSGAVTRVAWSPDGTKLATGSEDQTARVWDNTGNLLTTLVGHAGAVTSVAWNPDGTQLVTGSEDQTAKLWDSSGNLLTTLVGHTGAVTSVAWSPNGAQLVTGSADQTAKLWDVGTGSELRTFSGHSGAVTSVAWSPDGTQMVTGSADQTAKLWDVGTDRELLNFTGHSDAVTSVAWNHDFPGLLATGSADQTAKVWDVGTGSELLTLTGHSDTVTSVAWRNQAFPVVLATGSKDATAKVWNVRTDTELLTLATPVSFSVRWTGQIQPRFSERYSFHLLAIGGTRLWINDELIIDTWKNPQSAEAVGGIALTAGRWYSLRLEYWARVPVSSPQAGLHLSWSSRSQLKEIIPQSRLYSILDDTVNLDVPPQTPGCGTLLVGHTIVGESGPLQASQFGTPLFNDTAHLFTVSLPAARVPRLAQRRELKRVVEDEKPAHTDFHLCFVEPRMRVGFQSSLGIDTIVAGPSEPMSLAGTWLGLDSVLGAEQGDSEAGRVGKRGRLGQTTVLG